METVTLSHRNVQVPVDYRTTDETNPTSSAACTKKPAADIPGGSFLTVRSFGLPAKALRTTPAWRGIGGAGGGRLFVGVHRTRPCLLDVPPSGQRFPFCRNAVSTTRQWFLTAQRQSTAHSYGCFTARQKLFLSRMMSDERRVRGRFRFARL